jgi:hypothetical protein
VRAFFAIVLGAGVPITIAYAVACGPPGSFDNITGGPPLPDAASDADTAASGLREDPTIEPPRPIGPLAGSWLNGSRPKFRWESGTPDAVGARIIVCTNPACDPATSKTWDAPGTDFTAAEDLPPGRYFWKLKTITGGSVSTKESKTWPMLVRGGKGDGIPMGSFADINGDGISDLFISVAVAEGGSTFHDMLVLHGTSREDPLALSLSTDNNALAPRDYAVGISADLALQVVDVDGDGIGDPVVADTQGTQAPGKFMVVAYRGSVNPLEVSPLGNPPLLPGIDVLPSLVAPGDIDGDGHGDVLVASRTIPYAVFGTANGLGPFGVLGRVSTTPNEDAGELPPPTVAIPMGGVDVDHDGRMDVALASYVRGEGLGFKLSQARAFNDEFPVASDGGLAPTPATTFGFGDVDGDGENDTAFATTIASKAAVCILTSAAELKTGKIACWSPDTVPAGFASSIVAADLEGDGMDEILVGTAGGGVDVLRLPAPDKIEAEHLAIDYGGRMTVLDPGRPKAAVWAATRADGTSIALFQGKEQKKVIAVADVNGQLPIQIVRFEAGIR